MRILRVGKLLPHAKARLWERFGLTSLPPGMPAYIRSLSNNRRLYQAGEVYFVIRKSDRKVITVWTREIAEKEM